MSPTRSDPQIAGNAGKEPTIRDVATAARTSVGTVSNVLNRPNVVAVATRQRVLDAIERLGFVKHAGAAIRSGRARTIGLIVLDIANPFFTELARGAETAAREEGLLVILCNSDEDAHIEMQYIEALEAQRVTGVLLSPVDEWSDSIDWMRRRGTSIVLLERSRPDYCSVEVDDISGGALAADHLLHLGHRALAFVTGALSMTQYSHRLDGVRRSLRRRGLPESALTIVESTGVGDMADGSSAAEAILSRGITGVLCSNDLLALGVIGALGRAGVAVPAQMSVVGYDDIELAGQSALPLTTVRQHKMRMGYAAAKLMMEEADELSNHQHQQVVFQPELVVRHTTAAPHRRSDVHAPERG